MKKPDFKALGGVRILTHLLKQSQSVIAQIERDYYRDTLKDKNQKSVYGVFSNEDNTFKYYNFEKRHLKENKKYNVEIVERGEN